MDSLGTGTGIGFQDWTVSEPESESKKLEPGTSGMVTIWTWFIMQMRLAFAIEHYRIKVMSLAGMHISVKNHSAASTVNKNSLQLMMKTI